jgi:hypothetical protein
LLPLTLLPLASMFALVSAPGCEAAVNINAPFDGAVFDSMPCPICADVSPFADYDAGDADVSIYGLQAPPEAGPDARHDATVTDSSGSRD